MATEWKKLVCSTCGGTLEEKGEKLVCAHCKSTYQAKEQISEAEVIALNSATVDRNRYRFDDAQEKYDLLLKDYPDNAEANWGAFLCSYGIIYEEDYDGKYLPTCHRLSERPVEKSPYYAKLTAAQKKRAKEIEALRLKILEETKKIKPYDVFICYKQNEEKNGVTVPTRESKWARDIYEKLTNKHKLRVFFAEKSLSGSNADYEPHIYAALRSAKLMFVLTTSLEHLNAVWVANEWKRYVSYIRAGEDKTVRVVYDNVEPYDFPKELQGKQMIDQDSDWMAAVEAAVADMKKVVTLDRIEIQGGQMSKKSATILTETLQTREIGVGVADTSVSEKQVLKIAEKYLKGGQWSNATQMVDGILYSNPNCTEALWYKFLAKNKIMDESGLAGAVNSFEKEAVKELSVLLQSAGKELATKILDGVYEGIKTCTSQKKAVELLDVVLPYAYERRAGRIYECFTAARRQGHYEVFKKLLSTLSSTDVKEYIAYNLDFAISAKADEKDKLSALQAVLEVDEGNSKALNALFDMQIANEEYESARQTFEKILKFSKKPDKEVSRILNKLAKKVKSAKGLEFCKNVMKYYSGELLDLKNGMLDLGFKGISACAFDKALEFFNLVLSVDAEEKDAYWGIALAKIHAKSEKDVLLCDTSLVSVPEYTKYLTLVDEERLEACMELTKKQETEIKERQLQAEQRKLSLQAEELKCQELQAEKQRLTERLAKENAKKEKARGKRKVALIGSIILMLIGMGGCGACWTFDLDIEAGLRVILGAVGGFLFIASCVWMGSVLAASQEDDNN